MIEAVWLDNLCAEGQHSIWLSPHRLQSNAYEEIRWPKATDEARAMKAFLAVYKSLRPYRADHMLMSSRM